MQRNRFAFLYSVFGILRCESLIHAELSDLFFISHKNIQKDPHEWDALIMSILQGKTNANNKLYGRAMRARSVFSCPLGALGLYLMARFELTKEFEGPNCPDFTINSDWYDIKLLVGFGTNNGEENPVAGRTKEMNSNGYNDAVKGILKSHGIPSNHYGHLGRVLGAANLQFQEIPDEEIRQLGNWQVTVRDQSYSTKLPLPAMRAMAGFIEADGMFFCPRSEVEPPEELQHLIFPFVDENLEKVEMAQRSNTREKGGCYLGSAKGFLHMLKRLRTIILQDVAAMYVEDPVRTAAHPLFSSFPAIFHSTEFNVSLFIVIGRTSDILQLNSHFVLSAIQGTNEAGIGDSRNAPGFQSTGCSSRGSL